MPAAAGGMRLPYRGIPGGALERGIATFALPDGTFAFPARAAVFPGSLSPRGSLIPALSAVAFAILPL